MVRGQDYFRLSGRQFPAWFGEIETLQVLPEQRGAVAVIVTHAGGPSTITIWEPRDSRWKAVTITFNAPDSVVAAFHARYEAVAQALNQR
jgi:hypothetical protein